MAQTGMSTVHQIQIFASLTGPSPSAQRMNMNSRGCQPTESPSQNVLDPEGVEQSRARLQGDGAAPSGPGIFPVGFRGCQPTEQRPKTNSALKGSNHEPSGARWIRLRPRVIVRPLQGREIVSRRSVGFTHGYSCASPPVNGTPVRVICESCAAFRRAAASNSTPTN